MKTELVWVTPAMARNWLNHDNTINRPYRARLAKDYARDILTGRWETTHQGIAFDTEGKLSDGQHRLGAIVEANTPVQLMVTTGMDRAAFGVLDRGMRRSIADDLRLPNSIAQPLSYAATLIARFEASGTRVSAKGQHLEKAQRAIQQELEDLVHEAGSKNRRTTTATKLAAAVRLREASPLGKKDIIAAWGAYARLDYTALIVYAKAGELARRVDAGNINTKDHGHHMDYVTALSYKAFDLSDNRKLYLAATEILPGVKAVAGQLAVFAEGAE